jgi:hypothetical protein
MLSRSSAAHRARLRVNAAANASARSRVACAYATAAACCARSRRLYHVDRETPSASHGCFAGRLGPMPCALRQRSERRRAFSRRSASIIVGPFMQFGHWTAPRNDLIRAIIEDFATRLVPGGILIYAGDTGEKWGYFDAPLLAGLGVNVESWQNAGRGVALPGAPLIAAG